MKKLDLKTLGTVAGGTLGISVGVGVSVGCAPACPPAAVAYSVGRPMSTDFAPSASALTTSLPRRKPLSTSTVVRFPTASTISGSTSIGAIELSKLRPP